MKCSACGGNYSLTRWRTLNLNPTIKTTIKQKESGLNIKRPISYYTIPGKQQYTNIYACPKCGTLKIRTPLDKS